MQTLEGIRKRIDTTADLLSVVKTMKSLAAVNIRHFENAAKSVVQYAEVVDDGWKVFFRNAGVVPHSRTSKKAVIFVSGSDQGMCGQFNEVVRAKALQVKDEMESEGVEVVFWTCGERLKGGLEDAGFGPELNFKVAGSLRGVNSLVLEVEQSLEQWQRERRLDRLAIVHNIYTGAEGFEVEARDVLPIGRAWEGRLKKAGWPGKSLPATNISDSEFFSSLFREYLFVTFYGAMVQSLAAENAARLAAMQVAEKNIDELMEDLEGKFRETRQAIVTGELLDIVSGVEAVIES